MYEDIESKALQSLENMEAEEAKDATKNDAEDTSADETTDEVEDEQEDSSAEETDDTDDEEDGDDEGYSADELDEEEPKKPEAPKTDPNALPPREKYVYDELPTMSVTGADGQVYRVKTPYELPDDFEYASAKEQAKFSSQVAAQETRAQELVNKYEKQKEDDSYNSFVKQEQLDIQSDIADLQKAGDLPKFKLHPTDPEFDKDPAVKEVQKYLEFYMSRNSEYIQNGKAYRISFKDAVDIYKAKHPNEVKPVKGDSERKKVSKKVGMNRQGAPAKEADRRRNFRPGTDVMDILDYHLTRSFED